MSNNKNSILADIYTLETESILAFGNDLLELRFSMDTGNLIAGLDKKRERLFLEENSGGLGTVLLRIGGDIKYPGVVRNSRVYDLVGNQEIGHATAFEGFEAIALDRKVSFAITKKEGDWEITSIFIISPGDETIGRDLRLTYRGEGEVLLRDVRLLVPGVQTGAERETFLEAPDYPVTAHFPITDLNDGVWEGLDSRSLTAPGKVQHSVDAPGSVVGLVALHNPLDACSVMCWPHSTSEFSIMEVVKEQGQIHFVQWLFLADRFTSGDSVQAGHQFLRLQSGSWNWALNQFQGWYDEINLVVPQDRPDWVLGTAIYEVHVGRAPFLNGIEYAPYPTMIDLLNDLPRIASMGFEVVQIMPHWPFCGYTVHDYHQIDHQYGKKEDLIAVVNLAHDLGMRVILDVVLHGCVDKEIIRWDMEQFGSHYDFIFNQWLVFSDERSRYRDENSEWFMQDEAGKTAKIYTWAFDPANRAFQIFIINVLKHYLNELGIDGFRFDAPTWNCMPNWKRGLPYRASASYYGAYHLLNLVRKEIRRVAPEALLYTEPSGPLFRHSMDLTYNYDVEWLSGSLLEPVSERGFAGANFYTGQKITAKDAALWLHYQRLILPEGSITVQHLDSHDTFWWGELAQFRHEAFGLAASKALFALFALLGGGIMTYVGAENGAEMFYRRLINLRQSNAILRYGDCETLAVTCDDEMVFPLLRSYQDEVLIPLINLNENEIETVIHLPSERFHLEEDQEVMLFDLFNSTSQVFLDGSRIETKDLVNLPVTIPGYSLQILKVIPIVS